MNLEKYKTYIYSDHPVPRHRIKFNGKDNLHFEKRQVDSYGKPFNLIVSEREAGKSTTRTNLYSLNFQHEGTWIALRRQIADCTETYISDIEKILNKFSYVPVRLLYKTSDIKNGIIDVYAAEVEIGFDEDGKQEEIFHNKRLFFRVLGMSNPMSRIKSLMMPNLDGFVFDEYICNTALGEKYLTQEAFRFKEIFNTFQREARKPLKCYFFGNPYSVFNPFHTWLGIDTRKIRAGALIVGKNYVMQCYKIKPELKEQILKRNPLYEFDDAYRKYAFDGLAVNDLRIPILREKPSGAFLAFVLRAEGTWLGVYRLPPNLEDRYAYLVDNIEWNKDYKRKVFCFDFNNMESNTLLIQKVLRDKLAYFKFAIANNLVAYSRVDNSYLIEYIYNKL